MIYALSIHASCLCGVETTSCGFCGLCAVCLSCVVCVCAPLCALRSGRSRRRVCAGIYTISTSLSLKQIYYLDHCIELSSYLYPVPRLPIIEVSSSSESHFSR